MLGCFGIFFVVFWRILKEGVLLCLLMFRYFFLFRKCMIDLLLSWSICLLLVVMRLLSVLRWFVKKVILRRMVVIMLLRMSRVSRRFVFVCWKGC